MIYAGDKVRIINRDSKHFDKIGYATPIRGSGGSVSYEVSISGRNIVFQKFEVERA